MSYPPQPGQPPQPYGHQQHPHLPVPQPYAAVPSPYGYAPVQTMVVKERGFNPVTFGVHACLWVFLHWWMTLLTIGIWLLVAIPVSFLGWRVQKTVPVQQVQGPYPHM